MEPGDSQTVGANPLASFPNDKVLGNPNQGASWAAPQQEDYIQDLRDAVKNTDWGMLFAQGRTKALASSSWCANEERCSNLRDLCISANAKRVLEVGSFCGVGALSMAQVLPEEGGSILSLESDPFVVDFGLDIKVKTSDFWKINCMVSPARESLKSLVERVKESDWQPFDLAVIDADKAGVVDYFEIVADTPGFMNEVCTVCIDITPYRGQLFSNYVKYGKADEWVISSGQTEIASLRRCVAAAKNFEVTETAGLLIAHRKAEKKSKSIGAHPLAAFPNDNANFGRSSSSAAIWSASQPSDPVDELRDAVHDEDWATLFVDGCTMNRVEPFWCATPERCERLEALCKSTNALRVLEIGTFCGVATLTMAQALPDDASILSLDLDPFVVKFGEEIKNKSDVWKKVRHMIGPAKDSLEALVAGGSTEKGPPFDLVVIDADKAGMLDYFKLLWESKDMLSQEATIVIDTTPFKGQLYVQYVKGKLDDFIVKSGQDSIEAFLAFVRSISELDVTEGNGLTTLKRKTR